jgi:hypothetical protein
MSRMITAAVGMLAGLMFAGSSVAGEGKVIVCDGFMSGQGMSVPNDIEDKLMKKQASYQQYVVDDSYIIISGTGRVQDERLSLCESTAGQYRYSYHCDIKDQHQFAMDWISEKDINSKTSPFFKKYLPKPESIFGGKFISLDRVSLNITDEDYDLHTRVDVENVNGKKKAVPHNYIVLYRFTASCKLAKPKV